MSEWPMRDHFRYLHFKTFPMTPRTPQCKVFWALLSSSEHSRVPEDSNFSKCWASPPHLAKMGLRQLQVSTFGSGSCILPLCPKWGCDTSPWVTWCPNTPLYLISLLTFYFLGDTPFHPLPLLLKWTRLWTWIPQPLRLGSLQKGLFYSGGLCPWPWKTCPLHNIETPYSMHTHKVAVTNLRWDNLMLVILCIFSDNPMIL
jgi:hypothetical protein